jgi:hypothetical protein
VVSVPLLTDNRPLPYAIGQGERRLLAAAVSLARGLARLPLWRIDSEQVDALAADLDRVAVDDRGATDRGIPIDFTRWYFLSDADAEAFKKRWGGKGVRSRRAAHRQGSPGSSQQGRQGWKTTMHRP